MGVLSSSASDLSSGAACSSKDVMFKGAAEKLEANEAVSEKRTSPSALNHSSKPLKVSLGFLRWYCFLNSLSEIVRLSDLNLFGKL